MADKKITVRIAAKDQASRVLNNVQRAARRLGPKIRQHVADAFKMAKIAIIGATVAAAGFIKKIISVGAETETARIRLDSIFGSVEKGAEAFEAVKTAAAQLPYTFSDTLEAASLMGVAVRRTGGDLEVRLKQLAEISARFGIGLREAGAQFQRLALGGAASADMFRERGVNAFLGIQAGAKVSAEESLRLWDAAFERIEAEGSSAVERLADTWQGQISMLQDALRELAQAISDTGLLEFAKNVVTEMTAAVRLFADAVKTDLGASFQAAGGYLGAKLGEGLLLALATTIRDAKAAIPEIVALQKLFARLHMGLIAQDASLLAGGLEKMADAAGESASAWAEMLSIMAGGDTLGAVELPPAPGSAAESELLRPAAPSGRITSNIQVDAPGFRGSTPATPWDRVDIAGNINERLAALAGDIEPPEIPPPDIPDWIAQWVPTYEREMSAFGKDAAQGAAAIGEQIINGLVNGTLDAMDILKSALKIVVSVITNGLIGGLGIFSPSKVTYGFGQNIVQGMILGMDSMGGALTSATNRMAGAVTGGLTLPQVGGLGGVVGTAPALTATIKTDDTSSHPPWALDWLARGNIELKFAGE